MPARRAKPRQIPAPKTFYIDNRAASLLAEDSVAVGGTSDDDLLETREVADWIKVSYQRLTIGRIRNYGPKFIKVSPHRVAYRRGDIRAWLKSRTFSSTAEARNAEPGYLLAELEYLEEADAADALGIALATLQGYRKNRSGPDYTEVGRGIFYSKQALAAWLQAGGTKACERDDVTPITNRRRRA